MKRISYIFGVVVAIAACGPIQHEANARGFGGRGGGGGFRGGVSGLSAGGPGGGLRAQGPRDFDGSGAFRGGDLKSSGESHGNFGGGRVNGFTGNPGDVGPVFNGGDAFRESSRPLGGVSIGNTPGRSDLGPHRNAWDAGRPGAMGAGPFYGLHDGPVGGVDLRTPANSARTPGDAGGFDRNPYTDVRTQGVGGGGIRGPNGGPAAWGRVNHHTRYVSPADLRTQGVHVRNNYHYNCFSPNWYRAHPAAWTANHWGVGGLWGVTAWGALAACCGIAADPMDYYYGGNVVYTGDNVYVNGSNIGTATDYYNQAAEIAGNGRDAQPPGDEAWQSLGVFGMVQEGETVAQHIFQLAIRSSGVIRGNYYDAVADNTLPVYGAVDPSTQRAAWSVGDKKTVVFETGLSNLTKDQAPILVHYGPDRTQQMILVRIQEPASDK